MMSKKMKGVASDSSPFVPYVDVKARFKHQTLMQDFQELQKETEAMRNKLETMKQRKSTLLAEVRFLRRRHKHLLANKGEKPPRGRELVQQRKLETQCKNTSKEKNCLSRTKSKLRNAAPIVDVNEKDRISNAKNAARRTLAPVINLNQKNRIHSGGKETSLRNTTPVFDLNHMERTYGGKLVAFQNSTPIFDLNQMERTYSGKETTLQNPAPAFDLNLMERSCAWREDAVQNRAPIFDLNQILGEDDELQNNYEPLRMEEPKSFLIRGGTDEQLSDLKLSICRNVGKGPSRAGKRKITWQDQVALKV